MKIHLVHSAEPIKEGGTVEVACGREVAHAWAVYMIDYSICDLAYSISGLCRRCARVDDRKRYLYGVTEAQEAILEGSQ